METVRLCGCKGIRTCLICEKEYSIKKVDCSSELKVSVPINKLKILYLIFCNFIHRKDPVMSFALTATKLIQAGMSIQTTFIQTIMDPPLIFQEHL